MKDRELILRKLLVQEIATSVRLGKLVNKLERKLRRWKRKSARQHEALSENKRWFRRRDANV